MWNSLSFSYFCMTDMLTTHIPVDSSPAISAALPSSPLHTSPQHPSPAAIPPSPVWVCLAGYAIPPVAGCACMQDGVHAHHPDSSGTCMQTAEPEDWHKKHMKVPRSCHKEETAVHQISYKKLPIGSFKPRTEENDDGQELSSWKINLHEWQNIQLLWKRNKKTK